MTLNSMGNSRLPCLTPTLVLNHSPIDPLWKIALVSLLHRCFVQHMRWWQKLYFFIVAHNVAYHTQSNAFLKSMRTCCRCCRWCAYFSDLIYVHMCVYLIWILPVVHRLSLLLVVSVCSGLFNLAWVPDKAHGRMLTNDCVHDFGHLPVFHIKLEMVIRTSMILTAPVRISYAGMLSMPGDLPIFSELTAVSSSCRRIGSCDSLLCCCLPTPMTLASGAVRSSRLWSTSQLLRPCGQGTILSTNPGMTMCFVCGFSWRVDVCCVCECYKGGIVVMGVTWYRLCVSMIWERVICLFWAGQGCDEWGGEVSLQSC